MLKANGKFTRTAIAAVAGGALILPASGAFAASKTERAVIGAVLGGVAGAAISNGDGGATAAGAAAGALLGVATAKDKHHRHGYYRSGSQRDVRYYRSYDRRAYDRPYYGRYDTRYTGRYDARDARYDPYGRW